MRMVFNYGFAHSNAKLAIAVRWNPPRARGARDLLQKTYTVRRTSIT